MTDDFSFWLAQLAGQNPDFTPGHPESGFYKTRRRRTEYAPILGKRRNKATVTFEPVAIWRDNAGLHCVIGAYPNQQHITDADRIDEIFSYCLRNAIDHHEYEELANENQRLYQRDFNRARKGAG
jgi:hypothetical protein